MSHAHFHQKIYAAMKRTKLLIPSIAMLRMSFTANHKFNRFIVCLHDSQQSCVMSLKRKRKKKGKKIFQLFLSHGLQSKCFVVRVCVCVYLANFR